MEINGSSDQYKHSSAEGSDGKNGGRRGVGREMRRPSVPAENADPTEEDQPA